MAIEVWTSKGWCLYLDDNGQVIDSAHGDNYEEPASELVDVLEAVRTGEAEWLPRQESDDPDASVGE